MLENLHALEGYPPTVHSPGRLISPAKNLKHGLGVKCEANGISRLIARPAREEARPTKKWWAWPHCLTNPPQLLSRKRRRALCHRFHVWYDFSYKGAGAVAGSGDKPPSHSEENDERCTLYPARGEVCIHHNPSE